MDHDTKISDKYTADFLLPKIGVVQWCINVEKQTRIIAIQKYLWETDGENSEKFSRF